MAIAERQAQARWEGDLTGGGGTVTGASSGAFGSLPVTWAARTEAPDGKTSPEELIAAAHASCFSMALSHELAQGGNAPERIDVVATVTLDRVDGAPTVTRCALEVRGRVPGIDAAAFEAAAQGAGANCPISRLLAGGSAEITVAATLEG
jgi:osmotically inducible protein OsmC